MPSADTVPSLLSRLSPAPPFPSVARSSPGRELPPHLQHALGGDDLQYARSPPSGTAFPASPPKPSFISSSPPKPSTSPRKGNAFRSPQPGSHLTPLPDDVLKKTQPIPATRSTRSSRWAASPPTSPQLGSSPQAVFGSAPSHRAFGSPPVALSLSASPSASAAASPPKQSAALDQIESMLAQLRATPSSSPPKQSSSPPKPSSPLPRHSPLAAATVLPPVPASAPPLLAAPVEPAPAPAPAAPKKKVLGGRSKWARADDDEPDEYASVKEQERQREEAARVAPTPQPVEAAVMEAQPAAPAAPASDARPPSPPLPTPVIAPPSPVAAPPPAAEEQTPASPPTETAASPVPPVSATPAEPAPVPHLSWADDDDEELPDLDDWGITTAPPSFLDDEPEPPAPFYGAPPAQPQPSLPPLGARRRSHSNTSGGAGGGKHGRGGPPPLHPQHAHAPRSPPMSPRAVPPKAPSRLFASAAAARAGRELPPHVAVPVQVQPPKVRERMAPPGALFSRLSGIAPPSPAANAGRGAPSPAGAGAGAGPGAGKRRSRGGKPRASGAGLPPPPPPAAAAPAEGGSWRARGAGGAGGGGSKWA